ncbi:MAG: NUDIX hydrolase [Proteobacteria bacterium]|nr:NUDIX hydrolase [Pseudomonadota bacterium]
MRTLLLAAATVAMIAAPAAAELPEGYWSVDQTQPILDATLKVTLAPDLSHLSAAESQALGELLAAGNIMQALYEQQLHPQALTAKAALDALHDASGQSTATQNLLDLYYIFKGPIVTTLENDRLAMLPVTAETLGKNVYPADLERAEIDAFLAENPADAESILGLRAIVRRATTENVAADLDRLGQFPEIDALHPGLRQRLESTANNSDAFYAVPYALAYAPQLREIRKHLIAAANLLAEETPDFAAYLRNRGRDLLTGDYESGDASWVSGTFAGLNIQIGSYETYNDNLLGVKAFYSTSILARDEEKSRALQEAIAGLQSIENSLPYDHHKTLNTRIPVGVYNVIADFGQARGANTATILPNDADFARKYGRTILIRNNILNNVDIFNNRKTRFDAVIGADNRDDLTSNGGFDRTLWHEIGHYLGVSKTADGRDLGSALAARADLFEELKSDLVSLFVAPALERAGYHDETTLRAHYADGIRRTLQIVQPRAEQPYQTMQLMQFNFYMEFGLLEPDAESGLLTINYDRYHEVIEQMLRQVLQVQYSGDYELANQFVERWNYWEEKLHGELAERLRNSGSYRRTMVRYRALATE